MNYKPILCLDFDGVIHSYTSGWQGPTHIPDKPVPGAIEALIKYLKYFNVQIYSSRSRYFGGRRAMKKWLLEHYTKLLNEPWDTIPDAVLDWLSNNSYLETFDLDVKNSGKKLVKTIKWASKKPPAFVQIDDRALTFKGVFPSAETLKAFKPWNKK